MDHFGTEDVKARNIPLTPASTTEAVASSKTHDFSLPAADLPTLVDTMDRTSQSPTLETSKQPELDFLIDSGVLAGESKLPPALPDLPPPTQRSVNNTSTTQQENISKMDLSSGKPNPILQDFEESLLTHSNKLDFGGSSESLEDARLASNHSLRAKDPMSESLSSADIPLPLSESPLQKQEDVVGKFNSSSSSPYGSDMTNFNTYDAPTTTATSQDIRSEQEEQKRRAEPLVASYQKSEGTALSTESSSPDFLADIGGGELQGRSGAPAPNVMEVSGLFETASPWKDSRALEGFTESLGANEYDDNEDLPIKDSTLTEEDLMATSVYSKAQLVDQLEEEDQGNVLGSSDTATNESARDGGSTNQNLPSEIGGYREEEKNLSHPESSDISSCKDFTDFGNKYVGGVADASMYELNKYDPFNTPEKRLKYDSPTDHAADYVMVDPDVTTLLNLNDTVNPMAATPEKTVAEILPGASETVEMIEDEELVPQQWHHQIASCEANAPQPRVVPQPGDEYQLDLATLPTTRSGSEEEKSSSRVTSQLQSSLDSQQQQRFDEEETVPRTTNITPSPQIVSNLVREEGSAQDDPFEKKTVAPARVKEAEVEKREVIPKISDSGKLTKTQTRGGKMSSEKTGDQVSSTSPCPFSPSSLFKPEALNPQVAELVYWKDPKKSGIAFGTGLVILLALACCSVISVVAYTALLALTGTLSFRIYKNILQAVQKTNEGHPFKEYLDVDLAPNSERVHQIVDVLIKHFGGVANKLRSVFLVEDIIDSIKFVVLFWVLTYIGSWFNGLTLVILAYIGGFALPKAYEMNKAQVDQVLQLACAQVKEVVGKVKAVIPFPAKKDAAKSQ